MYCFCDNNVTSVAECLNVTSSIIDAALLILSQYRPYFAGKLSREMVMHEREYIIRKAYFKIMSN
jgi:hypothetical protein